MDVHGSVSATSRQGSAGWFSCPLCHWLRSPGGIQPVHGLAWNVQVSFTHMSSILAGAAFGERLSWDSQLEHPRVVSWAWWPRESWTSYMAAQGSKRKRSNDQDRHSMAFHNQALEVTWHHLCLCYWSKKSQAHPELRRRVIDLHFSMGGESKNLQPCFKNTPPALDH